MGGAQTIEAKLRFLASSRLTNVFNRISGYAALGLCGERLDRFREQMRLVYLPRWVEFFHGPGRTAGMGIVTCGGQFNGSPCPHGANGRPVVWRRSIPEEMACMEIDHEHEIALILDSWSTARAHAWAVLPPDSPAPPWEAGIAPAKLCHALFGIVDDAHMGAAYVVPRCHKCHMHMPHSRVRIDFCV